MSPTSDRDLPPSPANLPPPWALRGAFAPTPPPALARIMRGVVLPPLLIGGFGLGVGLFGIRGADFVWYLFVGQLGLLATPVAFLETALHGRKAGVQASAAGSLLILLTGVAWLFFGQSIYAHEVLEGKSQASALRSTLDFTTLLSPNDVLALSPLSLPFAGSMWLELRGIRRRWHPFLLLICLPPAMILLGLWRAGHATNNSLVLTLVLACGLLIPISNALANRGASHWRTRRGA